MKSNWNTLKKNIKTVIDSSTANINQELIGFLAARPGLMRSALFDTRILSRLSWTLESGWRCFAMPGAVRLL